MPVDKPLPGSFEQNKYIWFLALGSGISLAVTAVYGFALSSPTGRLGDFITSRASPTVAVIALRVLSETTAVLLGGLISFAFDVMLWTVSSTRQGITIPTLLSLSAGTGVFGLIELLGWSKVGRHHISVFIRILSMILIPVMGIVIFSQINFVTIPAIDDSVAVSAGIGPYNVSQAFDFSPNGLSTYFLTQLNYVLIDPLQSYQVFPPTCPGDGCASFYFPGQVNLVSPAISEFDFNETDVVMVNNVQGWEIDFWSLDLSEIQSAPENSFISCPIYGHANNAFRLCITPSTLDVDHFMINWWVCPYNLAQSSGCLQSNSSWSTGFSDGSTAMRMVRHTFDAVYSPVNGTIISTSNVRPPATDQSLLPSELYMAIGHVFGAIHPNDTSSLSNIAPNSSASAFTNFFVQGLQNSTDNNGDAQSRRNRIVSLITLPLLMFHANGLNLYLISDPTVPSPDLPPELYTTMEFATMVQRVVISRWTVILYLAIGVMILGGCCLSLGWAMTIQRPPMTRFPLIDFAARVLSKGFTETSMATALFDLTGGDSKTLRKTLGNTKVYLGDVGPIREEFEKGAVGKIGFSLTDNVGPLKRGSFYE